MLGGNTYCATIVYARRRHPDGPPWDRWRFLRPLRHLAQVVSYRGHNHLVRVVDVRHSSNNNHTTNVMVVRA